MTLLSIMMVLLFTSLKICADSWGKGESKITDVNEIAVVYNFFQRDLSVAKPLWNDFSAEEKTFLFRAKLNLCNLFPLFLQVQVDRVCSCFSLYLLEEDNGQVMQCNFNPISSDG